MSNSDLRWGRVSRSGHYRKPRKTAREKVCCVVGSCDIVQNVAATCGGKWHKSGTGGSASVRAAVAAETKTAVPAGPRNGGNATEKHSGAFEENSYHTAVSAAMRAGQWYAENRETCPRPIIRTLKTMFDLTAMEAVEAIRLANGGAA